jgi:predicted transcriptional regulator
LHTRYAWPHERQGTDGHPLDWLRDFIRGDNHHFATQDISCEAVANALPEDPAELFVAMRCRLEQDHGISTRIVDDRSSITKQFYRS